MTVKTILTEPNKILRQISSSVDSVGNEEKKQCQNALNGAPKAHNLCTKAI